MLTIALQLFTYVSISKQSATPKAVTATPSIFKFKQPLFKLVAVYVHSLKRMKKIYRIFGKLLTEQIVRSVRAGCQLDKDLKL